MGRYDAAKIREQLDVDDVFYVLEYLGAEPIYLNDSTITAKTICHGGDSHKLYYYDSSHLFNCYSGDCGTFDIFDLIRKTDDTSMTLEDAIKKVLDICRKILDGTFDEDEDDDWGCIDKDKEILGININNEFYEMPLIDESVIANYPAPDIPEWEMEDIPREVSDYMGIRYNPISGGILIPHRDFYGRLVGIRERTLVKEFEAKAKYRPAIINSKMYNHSLKHNLYGLDVAKNNISRLGIAIIAEAEKSVLKSIAYLGTANNITVATCGKTLSEYQLMLLLNKCGVREIVIAFDSDYRETFDEDYDATVNNLVKIYDKFSSRVNISFMFDKEKQYLPYKASPFDCGKDVFMKLWRDRVRL